MILTPKEIDTENYFQRIKNKLITLKRVRHSLLDQWLNNSYKNDNHITEIFELRLFYNSILSEYYRNIRDEFIDDTCNPFYQSQEVIKRKLN